MAVDVEAGAPVVAALLHPLRLDLVAQQARVQARDLLPVVLAAYRELQRAREVVVRERVPARQCRAQPRAADAVDVAHGELVRVERGRVQQRGGHLRAAAGPAGWAG